MKIIAHVNQHVIKHNAKHGTKYPTLTVKHPRLGTVYCHEVAGQAVLVDSNARGRNPLSCGARVWIEYAGEGFEFRDFPMDWPTLKAMLTRDRADASTVAALEAQV
jgi:hypothetical protein